MYIAVQFRLMVLSFVIFMSFLVINQDLFVPEKSGNILLVNFFFLSAFKTNTGGALLAEDLLEYQCKYKLSIKYQFLWCQMSKRFLQKILGIFLMLTKQV